MPRKSKETLPQAAAGGEQFVKVAQADDANPDARQPSPEEMEAMLQGKNRTHFEGLGDAWAVLTGQNPAAIMPQVVGTVLHEGGTRPAWQWKRGGRDHVLMAWPKDQPVRASVLMAGEEGGRLTPVNAVPLLEGLPNDLTVEEVHPWESGLGANVAVSMIEGKNPMWFFDPLYGRDRDDLTPGVTHTFLLAGLAYGLRSIPRKWRDHHPGAAFRGLRRGLAGRKPRQVQAGCAAAQGRGCGPPSDHAGPPLLRIPVTRRH